VLSAFVVAGNALAQQTSFADVANGVTAPSSLKFSELTADFKAVRLKSAGESSPGFLGSMGGLMMMAGMQSGPGANKMLPAMLQLNSLNDLSWTTGKTVGLAGHDFLITYRLNTGFDTMAMTSPTSKLAASLTLNLVRTDTIISIAPDGTMTPDSLRALLKSSGVQVDTPPLRTEGGEDEATTAAILLPVFAQAKQAALKSAALSNIKQIGLAAMMYSSDSDDVLPYVQGTEQFKQVTRPYTRDDKVWTTANPNGGGFRFAMNLAGVSLGSIEKPAETPMIFETNAWPDGRRCVTFVDGHAKRVGKEEWASLEALLRKKYKRTAKWPIKG